MYNLRYHLASLVAVFFSLTIGLMLGTIVADRGTLDAQRDSIISGLRAEFEELNSTNDELRRERDSLSGFVDDSLPILIGGALEGRTVGVVINEGRADGLGALTDAIRTAGGEPVTIILTVQGLGLADPQVRSAVQSVTGPLEARGAEEGVAASLAAEWLSAGSRPLTDALSDAGVLRAEGLAQGATLDGVAVLASWDGVPDQAALALAKGFSDVGVPALGVETQSAPTGVAESAANRGLSAVDNVGTSTGALTVAYVLSGRATGYFGAGPSAEALYPRIEMAGE